MPTDQGHDQLRREPRKSTLVARIALVVFTAAIWSQTATANSYLMSNNAEWRCEKLSEWVDSIAPGISDRTDLPHIIENAAIGFSRNRFSRYIGRAFDDLTNPHLKQIRKDLTKCRIPNADLAAVLAEPFNISKARKTETGRQWLTAIYRAYDESANTQLQRQLASLSGRGNTQCSASQIVGYLGSDFANEAGFSATNQLLEPLYRAYNAQKIPRFKTALKRRIDDLDYRLQTIKRQPKRYHAPKIYESILQTDRDAIGELLNPEISAESLRQYVAAHIALLDDAESRITNAADSYETFLSLAAFQHRLASTYRPICISQNAVLSQFPLEPSDAAALNAAFQRLDSAAHTKLTRSLKVDEAAFLGVIETLNSDKGFAAFSRSVTPPMSMAQNIAGSSTVGNRYREQKKRYRTYKVEIADLIAEADEDIRQDAENILISAFSEDGWKMVPNNSSIFLSETAIAMYHTRPAVGTVVQLVVYCDPDRFVEGVKSFTWIGDRGYWQSPDENNIQLREYSADTPGGRQRVGFKAAIGNTITVGIIVFGHRIFDNAIRLEVPARSGDFRRWEIPVHGSEAPYQSPTLYADKGILPVLIDACFPLIRRQATLTIPEFGP